MGGHGVTHGSTCQETEPGRGNVGGAFTVAPVGRRVREAKQLRIGWLASLPQAEP